MSRTDLSSVIKLIIERSRGKSDAMIVSNASSVSNSIVAQPGLDQPTIILRQPNVYDYLLGGLKPNTKYRVQVRAETAVGLSPSAAMIELTTGVSLGQFLPRFRDELYSFDLYFSTVETELHRDVSWYNVLQHHLQSDCDANSW
jgi:hypothetical protein